MSSNSSNPPVPLKPSEHTQATPTGSRPSVGKRILYAIGLPLWVFAGFMVANFGLAALFAGLAQAGVSFDAINPIIFNTVASALVYALAIGLVLGVPWLIKRRYKTTRQDLGLQRLPSWMDLVWAPAGLVTYFILTAIVAVLAMSFLPFVDYTQVQETGYAGISGQTEYVLAFIMLVIVAPFAEELLFRGYLFGKLRKYTPLWVAILITSLLFAFVHFQWNVGLDVFALSIVLCLLRVVSGSLWPSILLHMMKNGIAYYFLFINPIIASTLGG